MNNLSPSFKARQLAKMENPLALYSGSAKFSHQAQVAEGLKHTANAKLPFVRMHTAKTYNYIAQLAKYVK